MLCNHRANWRSKQSAMRAGGCKAIFVRARTGRDEAWAATSFVRGVYGRVAAVGAINLIWAGCLR